MTDRPIRALLVDLNNYARYPTLAIGYLVASLRRAGVDVEVLSPLSHGVPALERERQETHWDHIQRRTYFSGNSLLLRSHDRLRSWRSQYKERPHPTVIAETRRALDRQPVDIVLLSAYLDHYPSVVALGDLAHERNVPVLLGGPMFNLPEVAHEWLGIRGLTAIVGAEVDLTLPAIVKTAVERGDLSQHAGVFLPDGRQGPSAFPLHRLERLPVPDFDDFPWDRYPGRVIPVMTGRGCSWGRCQFCSDVVTANGRGFRSRPVDAVLDELGEQSARYASKDVIFLDIKLNSSLEMWRGLIERFQTTVPGGRWIGTVHVQARGENGLTRDELVAARESGLTRTTFGLESGSQTLNDSMAKGTKLELTSQFIQDAHAAGISVRTTAMLGYPGETASDVEQSVKFFERHRALLDRVRLSRFKAIPSTPFHARYERASDRFGDLENLEWDHRFARASYRFGPSSDPGYRRAKRRLLGLVYEINRRPLRPDAAIFDGLM
jgi:anaerobic magnesium-protoporphyrin IX monomethyl ester cyclase